MMTKFAIALAAGFASALMFASVASGALVSMVLFYFAPLPLMVAALGWSAPHAAIGGLAAGSGLGLLFGIPYFIAFVLAVTLPACWLGHLALLARPASSPETKASNAEWYPPGRLLLWIVVLASITSVAALLTLGSDSEEIREGLRRGFSRMISFRGVAVPAGERSGLLDAFVAIAPSASALAALVTLTLNTWLAGRIARTSGRLVRSWPVLSETMLPPMTLVALPIALAFCFGDGMFAMLAQVLAAALLAAYALTGLATLHALTRGRAHRMMWLSSFYAVLFVFGWPAIGLVALGLTDAFFGLRTKTQPASPPSI